MIAATPRNAEYRLAARISSQPPASTSHGSSAIWHLPSVFSPSLFPMPHSEFRIPNSPLKWPRESVPAPPAPAGHDLLLTPPGRRSTCYKMLRCPVVSKVQRTMFSAQGNMNSEVTSKSRLALVACDFRYKCVLQKELRRYVPRSILPPKSPFRPHFGAFYPHPGSKSALRCGQIQPFLPATRRRLNVTGPARRSPMVRSEHLMCRSAPVSLSGPSAGSPGASLR